MNATVRWSGALALTWCVVAASASGTIISSAGLGVIEKPGNYTPRAGAYVLSGNPTEFTFMNGNSYLSLSVASLTNTIYLGGTYEVNQVNLWNYNEAADLSRGVKDYSIQASVDGTSFTTIYSGTLAQGTGNASNPMQSSSFTATTASVIRVIGTSSYGSSDKGLNHITVEGSGVATPQLTGVTIAGYSTQNNVNDGPEQTLDGSIGLADADRWMTQNGDSNPFVTYDLQLAYRLEALKIWNNNEGSRNFKTLQVLKSGDGITFTPIVNPLTGTTTFTLEDNLVAYGFQPSILYFGNNAGGARYVKLQQLTGGDGSYTGLTEVQFFGIIPEPSIILLLACGGGLLFWRRTQPD